MCRYYDTLSATSSSTSIVCMWTHDRLLHDAKNGNVGGAGFETDVRQSIRRKCGDLFGLPIVSSDWLRRTATYWMASRSISYILLSTPTPECEAEPNYTPWQ